jgi:hypothetical protein
MDAMKRTPNGVKAKVEMGTVDTRTSGVGVVNPEKAYQIWRIMDTVIESTAVSMVSGFNIYPTPGKPPSPYYGKANLFQNNLYLKVMTASGDLPKTGPNPPTSEQITAGLMKYMENQIRRVLTAEEDSKKDEFKKEFNLTNYIGADVLKNLIKSSYNKTVSEAQPLLTEVLNLIRPAYVKMYTDFTRKYYPDNSDELVNMMNSKLNSKPTYNLKDQVALYSRINDTLGPGQANATQNTATKTVQSREIGK